MSEKLKPITRISAQRLIIKSNDSGQLAARSCVVLDGLKNNKSQISVRSKPVNRHVDVLGTWQGEGTKDDDVMPCVAEKFKNGEYDPSNTVLTYCGRCFRDVRIERGPKTRWWHR